VRCWAKWRSRLDSLRNG